MVGWKDRLVSQAERNPGRTEFRATAKFDSHRESQLSRDFSLNTTQANSKLVLVLNEMVLVLLLGAPSGFEDEYEYRTG
jgi:hypothetical protein